MLLLEYIWLENILWWLPFCIFVSFFIYWGLGGWLQWNYYVRQRNKPEDWKCQPDRFLTHDNERHEFLMGSFNMLLGSLMSSAIACHIYNGGKCSLYFDVRERGWLYLLASAPVLFLYIEAAAFYLHKLFHNPFLYRNFHKWHHRYYSPTAFSSTAMHPFEFLVHQSYLILAAFAVPIHAGVFIGVILYIYYYGMMDHSGVKMDAVWPWQPSTMFHDDHHRYFHCNFGFNSFLFDWLHGTLRRKDRVYGEDIFGGHGKEVRRDGANLQRNGLKNSNKID
ncbi:hypothetical protein ScPMuIL_012872 [Solemya velum]